MLNPYHAQRRIQSHVVSKVVGIQVGENDKCQLVEKWLGNADLRGEPCLIQIFPRWGISWMFLPAHALIVRG